LENEIKDERLARKTDRGQLSKKKNPPLDALEHRVRRKETKVVEALKTWFKLN
jgi:hypothetical protein